MTRLAGEAPSEARWLEEGGRYGGNIGAIERHTFDPATSAQKRFVSGYTNAAVPNLWDRSTEMMA